ncbi:hypothetical protein NPIL_197891, partial [Nephila pilipes]
ESASVFTLARLESRSVMPAGNYTAWNMESNLTVTCPVTRLWEPGTILSIHSSVKLVPASMYQGPFSLILSQQ